MAGPKAEQCASRSVNMTPMIDVVFLLLIFFVVSTEFRVIEGLLPNNLPAIDRPPIENPIELRIVLTEYPLAADPTFSCRIAMPFADAMVKSPEEVTVVLGRMIAEHGDLYRKHARVVIRADPGVVYNDVVRVYDAVLAARMANVSFAL